MINKVSDKLKRKNTSKERAKKLNNHSFSIISNTCIGGVITNNVGEQFRSPTVNLIIYENDFIDFCLNIKAYYGCKLEKPNDEEMKELSSFNYPVGVLRGKEKGLSDIRIYFVHYASFEEAQEKWYSRFKRVNYDDIFIVMDRGMEESEKLLDEFYALPYKNKVFFTDKSDKRRWKNNFKFSFYNKEKYVAGCLYKHIDKGMKQYMWLDEFDYVHWLNTGEIQKTDFAVCQKED